MSGPLLPALASAIHLGSLAGAVACLFLRLRALEGPFDGPGLKRVFAADNAYGLLAATWIGSGIWRAFGGLEKGTDYYLQNHLFWGKVLLVVATVGLEILPVVTFIGWRVRTGRGEPVDTARVPLLRKIHWAELGAVALVIPLASLMARGVGVPRAALAADPASLLLAQGERIYGQRCATCHQADGRGFDGKLAADFAGDKARLAKDDATLLGSIEKGVPGTAMRGFGGELDEAQRRAVLGYIRRRFGGK
jgi:putative membrane protein